MLTARKRNPTPREKLFLGMPPLHSCNVLWQGGSEVLLWKISSQNKHAINRGRSPHHVRKLQKSRCGPSPSPQFQCCCAVSTPRLKSYWNDLNPTTLKYGGAWGGVTQRHQSHVYDKAPVRFSSWIATAKDVKSRCCCSRKQCEQWETKSGNLAWRDGKLYSSSLVSSSGAPRRSDLCWESFNAGTIYSLSIGDLFNNLFNNLLQNSQSVEILKQSQYVGADGKKNKFFFHSHDYQMAAGLPENSHILELWNRLLNRYWIDSWIDCE